MGLPSTTAPLDTRPIGLHPDGDAMADEDAARRERLEADIRAGQRCPVSASWSVLDDGRVQIASSDGEIIVNPPRRSGAEARIEWPRSDTRTSVARFALAVADLLERGHG